MGDLRVCIGMIVKEGREPYLDRVLSVMEGSFDGRVIVPDDGVQLMDYAAQRNKVIEIAEDQDYDWLFMLDADECMYPADIETVRKYMSTETLIILPRIELVRDFDHFDPHLYPDLQARVFKLGMGYHYEGRLHETLCASDSRMSGGWRRRPTPAPGSVSPTTPIYHYGRTKSLNEILLRYHNYNLIARGRATVAVLPDHVAEGDQSWWTQARPFPAMHPLRGSSPASEA